MKNSYRTLFIAVSVVTCESYGQVTTALNSGFAVNTMNREEVRVFFNAVFGASENVPIDWTGDMKTGNPGTTSKAFRDAIALRINYFRAMAGVPSDVVLSDELNRKAQQAALMMSANNELSHFPPASWKFYTAEGAQAAGNSNLHLGSTGPSAITGFMSDTGENNGAVGHRRWVLYPRTKTMGTGNIPNNGTNRAVSALWVIDPNMFWNDRPKTRDGLVAWPPKGHCPYQVVYSRWSFSYPDADFSASTVSMERDGQPLGVWIEPVTLNFGDNTLVWVPDDFREGLNNSFWSAPRPMSDSRTTVTVHDVAINGSLQDFTYTVTIFDPQVPGSDWVNPTIAGRNELRVNEGTLFALDPIPFASGYEWRVTRRTPLNSITVVGASSGSAQSETSPTVSVGSSVTFTGGGGFIDPGTEPNPTGVPRDAPGPSSTTYHLTHWSSLADEFLTVTPTILPQGGSTLRFGSRLGRASENQVATVEVSRDGGSSFVEIYRQAGDNGPGEDSSMLRTIDLSPFADRPITIRFAYHFAGSGLAYTGESGTGWYIDSISIIGAEQLTSTIFSNLTSEARFSFAGTSAGDFAVQVRPQVFQRFFGEWSPVKRVSVTGSAFALTAPSRSSDGAFIFILNGEVGRTFIIETSTNLRDWMPLRPVFTTGPATSILDANTAGEQARFYRAVQLP